MGAELSSAEITQILMAWEGLRAFSEALLAQDHLDTPEMTQCLASLVGRCHSVRRVIGDCWHAANKRAFPVEQAAKRATVHTVMEDLETLGITKQEILHILNKG
jgi:hypothetical protein